MKAHDAGLKGTLTDNGDGTATFKMDTLNAGDTVSIGGKNYTIGGEAADVTDMLTKAGITDAAGDKVTINGKEYTYCENASDGKTALTHKGYYETAPDTANAATANPAYADSAAIAAAKSATISVGTKSITTIDDTKADGIDDNDTSVITKQKAYELAGKELLAANQIGDTEGNAEVKNGDKSDLAYDAGNGTFNIKVGQAKVANTLSFSLHVGADADMTNKITVDIDTMNSTNLGIKGLNVTDKNGTAATYAIDAISDAISKVSSQRSALGAVQNRLEHTIDNLDNISENTSSAESRIRDTDMAKEMVNYSKNNILAQAGQSMLAQANQSTQGVLSLLQ